MSDIRSYVDTIFDELVAIRRDIHAHPETGMRETRTAALIRSELEKMSLWELYLARNEIFARHGRGFKNQDLTDYFATKRWYTQTYTPEEFDAISSSQLNDYELKNVQTMYEIEQSRNSPYLETAK